MSNTSISLTPVSLDTDMSSLGGSTYDPYTGENIYPDSGYFVSYEDYELRKAGSDIVQSEIDHFRYVAIKLTRETGREHYVGAWVDREGLTCLDVSRSFEYEEDAIEFGLSNGQDAIYDAWADDFINL